MDRWNNKSKQELGHLHSCILASWINLEMQKIRMLWEYSAFVSLATSNHFWVRKLNNLVLANDSLVLSFAYEAT